MFVPRKKNETSKPGPDKTKIVENFKLVSIKNLKFQVKRFELFLKKK